MDVLTSSPSTTEAPALGTDTLVSSDDFFSTASNPATNGAAPVDNPNNNPPTDTPPADTPPLPADAEDPFASYASEDTAPADSQTLAGFDSVVAFLGMDTPPETAEELQQALQARIQEEVRLATYDPVRQIDSALGLSDRDLVYQELLATKSRFDTEETLQSRLDQIESEDRLDDVAGQIRGDLGTTRDKYVGEQKAQVQADRDQRETYYSEMAKALPLMKSPTGTALPDAMQKDILASIKNNSYYNALVNQPHAWHLEQAARLHPRIGPIWEKQSEAAAQRRGASSVYRELERDTPQLGNGSALTGRDTLVGSDDFFNN